MSTDYDVIIIGAGISGLGAACHLQRECPNKSYIILEGRDAIGGTWDFFRYPGIRSDSDLFTFGYEFKSWQDAPIATAPKILNYLHEVVDEHALQSNIHFNHWVTNAKWSTKQALWTVQANTGDDQTVSFNGRFLFMCQGYYSYDHGYQPEFPGEGDFKGSIVHPQKWPETLDYTDKKMVVIGSGATAATIVPAVSDKVAQVTQLQRSPSYYLSIDNTTKDPLIEELEALDVPALWIHNIQRRKMLAFGKELNTRARAEPKQLRSELIGAAAAALPDDYDIATHFHPKYDPWKERLCLLPDGDMFQAISKGKASVVTGDIDRFVADGILLKSGETLKADIIVTATGIELCGLGNIQFEVDQQRVDVGDKWTYRGVMISDMPNLAWIFGYVRTSWTMRSDMIAHYVCRLLNYMDEREVRQCTPRLRPQDLGMNAKAFIDIDDFGPGYIKRGAHRLPKQSGEAPWINSQDYYTEKDILPQAPFDDGALTFDNQSFDDEDRQALAS